MKIEIYIHMVLWLTPTAVSTKQQRGADTLGGGRHERCSYKDVNVERFIQRGLDREV